MIKFNVSNTERKEVQKRCLKYRKLSFTELRERVKEVDQSESKNLVNHDSMKTKKQVLSFLYSWEYHQLNQFKGDN
jgi:hypothetical protein